MYTTIERMKEHAFEILREHNVRDFSPAELHRAFKHSKEKLLYTGLVNTAVENGFTIANLYDRDDYRGIER